MAPIRGDDLSEFGLMRYGKYVYLYHMQFDCNIEPESAGGLSAFLQTCGYRSEGEVMSKNSLVLASDEPINFDKVFIFPGCVNLERLTYSVGEFFNK